MLASCQLYHGSRGGGPLHRYVESEVSVQTRWKLADGTNRHIYKTIAREKGLRVSLGMVFLNISQNVVVNCIDLVIYDLFKYNRLKYYLMKDHMPCHSI